MFDNNNNKTCECHCQHKQFMYTTTGLTTIFFKSDKGQLYVQKVFTTNIIIHTAHRVAHFKLIETVMFIELNFISVIDY